MKTWIIILSVLVIVLPGVAKGIAEYIKTDPTAKLDYLIKQGLSTAGIVYTITILLWELSLVVDVVLLLIYFL